MAHETLDPTQWVDKYGDAMFRFALFRVRDEAQAEDIVQNAILAALQSMDSFEGRSSEKTWLFGILKYKIFDYFREAKKDFNFSLELKEHADPCQPDFDEKGHWKTLPYSWGINSEKVSEDNQIYQILAGCIDRLAPKFRHLYILREIEEQDTERICRENEITPNNLWVMLHRARNTLKKCMEGHLSEIHNNG